jgi:lactoylglutathione lyase
MKLHHVGIYVNDLPESETFYKKLGYKVETKLTILNEKITFMSNKTDGSLIELIYTENVKAVEGTIHLAWNIVRLEEKVEWLAANGYQPTWGPQRLENGWKTVFFQGPNLETIELLEIL